MEQMQEVSYCHSLFYATQAAEDLAKLLVDSTDGEMSRAFFVSSGSEAMEAALKMARQYHLEKPQPEPQRSHFISRHQSYHGTTLGALAAGGHVARRGIFEPMLATNSSRVSPCYAYRGLESPTDTETAYVNRLEAELEAEFLRVGPKNVAAFIAEPIVGAALGCVPPVAGYFPAIRRVCDKYGALLIFDEVMCGTGRVGPEPSDRFPKPLHAWQDPLIGVVPDLQTLGKGLGGGYMPVAAMLASAHVVEVLEHGSGAFSHGQTYQGHPLACRAALEVQRIIMKDDLVANVRKQGALLGRLLKEKLGNHAAVGNIRGRGLFWGIEFVKCRATKECVEPSMGVAMGIHELGEFCCIFLIRYYDYLPYALAPSARNLGPAIGMPLTLDVLTYGILIGESTLSIPRKRKDPDGLTVRGVTRHAETVRHEPLPRDRRRRRPPWRSYHPCSRLQRHK